MGALRRFGCDHEEVRTSITIALVLTASLPARGEEPAPGATFPVRGKLRLQSDGTPLAGGTITATPVGGGETLAAISDENGDYVIEVRPGRYTITVYYFELQRVLASNTSIANELDLGETQLPEIKFSGSYYCCCYGEPSPGPSAQPYFGLTVPRDKVAVSRDRTHLAWLGLAAGADVQTTVTTVARSPRLHGAPGIPAIFVEETDLWTLRAPIAQASGSGGAADVHLRSGSNDTHAVARAIAGVDRGGDRVLAQEVFLGTPIKKDRAWLAAGLAVDADRHVHGLGRVNFAASPEHQGEVIGLAQDTGVARDSWATARWTSKLIDNRLELHIAATAEQLELAPLAIAHAGTAGPVSPELVNRAGASLDLTYRKKARGYHEIKLLAAAGAGRIDGEQTRDLSLAAGDRWQLEPNLEVEVGARSDTRSIGDTRTTVVSPRVALVYDHTREGRSQTFAAYQRVPHLDDGLPGAWRTAAALGDGAFHDELAAGISHQREKTPWLMTGIAGRVVRRALRSDLEPGVDGWLRIENRRSFLHLSASTLRRAATVNAQRRLIRKPHHELAAATTVRTAQTAGTTVIESGGALTLRWLGPHTVATRAELYDGTLGPGARLLLEGVW